MNWKGFDKVAVEIDGADLPQAFKDAMRDAEKAYQSNRRALSLLDYHNDAVKGEKELLGLVSGIENWMTRVEDFWNAAEEVADRVTEALHAGRRDKSIVEDGPAHGDDGEGIEGVDGGEAVDGQVGAGGRGSAKAASSGQTLVSRRGKVGGGCGCFAGRSRRSGRNVPCGGV